MKVSVILGHPSKGSFNHAIAQVVLENLEKNGHQVIFHDLYEENFNPVLPSGEIPREANLEPSIAEHCCELSEAEGIIVIHPNWRGQPPAILKGWLDRTFRSGVAYQFIEGENGQTFPVGLLKAKIGLVFNTSDTPYDIEVQFFGDSLELIWKNYVFKFSGVENFYRKNFAPIFSSTLAQREEWLKQVKENINQYFPQE